MPRPAKNTDHLAKVKHLMGTMPDHEIAAMVGESAPVIGNYRRKYGIPAYQGYKFGGGQTPPTKKGRKAAKADKAVVETTDDTAPKTRTRRSKLDGLHAQIGKVPDSVIAEKAGVSVQNVRLYRRKHGISLDPSADRRRADTGGIAPMEEQETPPKASASLTSNTVTDEEEAKLSPFRDQLGRVPDSEVAVMADVAEEVVAAYRAQHSIRAVGEKKRGRPAKGAEARPAKAKRSGGQQGYTVVVETGGKSQEYTVVAAGIVEAAGQAAEALSNGSIGGDIVAIRLLGPALV